MSTPEDIHARLSMPKRLMALQQTGLMDSDEEEDFNRVARLAQAMVGCDMCLVSFLDADRQFFKASQGLPEEIRIARQTPLSHSFCKHVVASEAPFVVENAPDDARVAGNRAIEDLDVIAYLGMPIHGAEGGVLGSLCAIDRRPRAWSPGDQAVLRDFAHLLENVVSSRAYAREALRAANSSAVLAREYNHRIKNSFAVSAGLVRAAGRNAGSVEELVRDCTNRFASLGRAQDLIMGEHERTDLAHVVEVVLTPFGFSPVEGSPNADGHGRWLATGPDIALTSAQITPLALLLHELATNSVKYGALRNDAAIELRWDASATEATLLWRETTQLSDSLSVDGGFGTKVLEVAARQLAGRMTRTSAQGSLTVETVFPLGSSARRSGTNLAD